MRSKEYNEGKSDKILILGRVGSGKTTLAKKLSKKNGLEIVHLDDDIKARLKKDSLLRDRLKSAKDIDSLRSNYRSHSENAIKDALSKSGKNIIEGNQLYYTDHNLSGLHSIDIKTSKRKSDRRVKKREGFTRSEARSILKKKPKQTNYTYKDN